MKERGFLGKLLIATGLTVGLTQAGDHITSPREQTAPPSPSDAVLPDNNNEPAPTSAEVLTTDDIENMEMNDAEEPNQEDLEKDIRFVESARQAKNHQ